jgi:hypothetical protein
MLSTYVCTYTLYLVICSFCFQSCSFFCLYILIEKYPCPFDRHLHSDLASVAEDCRRASNNLEVSRQEVENLKHQLQEYVSEVR